MAPKSILHDNLMKIQGKQVDKIKSENKRDNQEWTIHRHWQHWAHTIVQWFKRRIYSNEFWTKYIFHELAKL
jgi:hypothetical protein